MLPHQVEGVTRGRRLVQEPAQRLPARVCRLGVSRKAAASATAVAAASAAAQAEATCREQRSRLPRGLGGDFARHALGRHPLPPAALHAHVRPPVPPQRVLEKDPVWTQSRLARLSRLSCLASTEPGGPHDRARGDAGGERVPIAEHPVPGGAAGGRHDAALPCLPLLLGVRLFPGVVVRAQRPAGGRWPRGHHTRRLPGAGGVHRKLAVQYALPPPLPLRVAHLPAVSHLRRRLRPTVRGAVVTAGDGLRNQHPASIARLLRIAAPLNAARGAEDSAARPAVVAPHQQTERHGAARVAAGCGLAVPHPLRGRSLRKHYSSTRLYACTW